MQIISDDALYGAPHYNEADVRFHVIDPIIRSLGYPSKDTYVKSAEKLEYPYFHIGLRSKKDLPLGRPDYRAGLNGARGSFIIEAKAGDVPITSREIEQAHSYAAHAQVGANYFVLCNGSVISVYHTLSGSDAVPITSIPLSEVNVRYHELENILTPQNLAKNCRFTHDTKLKLAEGLRSSARIRSGHYRMSDYEYRILMNGQNYTSQIRKSVPQLETVDQELELMKTEFKLRVSEGVVERCEDGRIAAHVNFDGVTESNHQAMKIMGITEARFATADKLISTDQNSPTIFESSTDFSIMEGTMIPQLFGGSFAAEGDLAGNMFIKVAMHYADDKMQGQYITLSDQRVCLPGAVPLLVEMEFAGTFELILDV
jgi:hypothetical protein